MRRPASGPVRPRLGHLLVGLCVPLMLVMGCGTDDSTAEPVSKESNTRPSTEPDLGEDTAADGDFCTELESLAQDQQIGDDPAAAVEALSSVGELAPSELQDDFEVLASVVDDLSSLDEDDPASIDEALGIVLRPEVVTASESISSYASEECGVDLDATSGDSETGSTTPDQPDGPTTGDIDLDDIDAVEEANASATWPDKITSTSIINDTDVTLSADDSALLTADEGLAACVAVREALVVINPQVIITIKSGETTVAAASAGAPCAAA